MKNVKRLIITGVATMGIMVFAETAEAATQHRVDKGDTLWGISRSNGMTVSHLKQMNGLSSDIIYVGQTLVLSVPPAPVQQSKSTPTLKGSYKVQKGDTLWGISRSNGMTVNQLKQLNGLSSDLIYIGQTLKLAGEVKQGVVRSEDPVSSTDVSVVQEAMKYIGTPYKWGGSAPGGFDCSGFINYVFKQNGQALPRTVAGLWSSGNTSFVKSSKRKTGDLVFFETYKKGASHAGIYLGNGTFIHSGSDGVEVSSMSNSYWSARYLGTKRVK
ncbi:C40 family peptidase (plasmid) [Pontibacillus sp. ALD_SL1]|uniref:C40 family peptidase n=1 Tax=Pontibacillus sp. ALD_SL1 TaxID=2777185 RepID=UPI001A96C785|nr:LysM peptidoglycan-binding domain-containing protein [Pontibacillus sp. ALD_SL1]QST02086.1 C40 family peptidase [Pontibacillus sp. ALD_SL1]